jgi:DNA-binding Lrp family transcriptional regulator
MKGYILVKFDPKADLSKASHAVSEPGVEKMDLVLGNWDAIVSVVADDMESLSRISAKIRSCPGIRDSVTYPVVPAESISS